MDPADNLFMHRSDAEWFRLLIETMNEGMAIFDKDDRILYANRRLCETLGVELPVIIGQDAKRFLLPDQLEQYAVQKQLQREGKAERFEVRLLNRRGQEVQMLVSPSPLFDECGQYFGSFGLFLDLTPQKQAEKELERERLLLTGLLEQVPEFVYILDREARFLMASKAQLEVLGANAEAEVLGKTDHPFWPAQLGDAFYRNNMKVIASGEPMLNLTEKAVCRDGRELWVLSSKVPLRNRQGEIIGLLGIGRDITERNRAEAALAESEERFRLLLEQSRDVVYRINIRTLRYEFISPSAEKLLGYTPQEFLNFDVGRLHELVHPGDLHAFWNYAHALVDAAKTGSSAGLGEYRMRTKSGEMRWLSDSAAVILDDNGFPLARIGAARDITEHKMAERALMAASRMEATTTLAGGIAHDFNNLMAAVLANAELLEMELPPDAQSRQMLHVIQRSAEQAGNLAQQMLAYARGGKYRLTVVDLNQTVLEVLELESHSLDPKVDIEQHLQEGVWGVYADASQMSQVVMNLTINAAEAMPNGGRLTVTTSNLDVDDQFAQRHPGLTAGRYVRLTVEDTGEGMTAQVMSRVFEPFYSTKFQGRGLGLAAVYGIVKNHNGHISTYSERGRGSVFTVYLPASDVVAVIAPEPPKELPRGVETVLIVDDEEVLLDATQRMLNKLGYEVLLARNGREALEMLAAHSHQVSLVLLDLAMPVMSGTEAHAVIAREHPKLPVIICSGYEIEPAARDIIERGACSFLQKPFRMQALASEVRRALDN